MFFMVPSNLYPYVGTSRTSVQSYSILRRMKTGKANVESNPMDFYYGVFR